MLLYHFPLTSSSATSTIVNKGLKDDCTISGDNNFSSGGKLSAYAKDMGENKFYLSIPNFSLDYTLCFRAKTTSNILLVSIGYTPFEITADNTWHDYVICDKKVYKDGLFLTNYNYSAGIVAFGDSEDSCQGLIQDIRIYDYALSQAEINEYSRALVVHYPLQGNELNPSVLKDVSGFGNDATLIENVDYIDSARYSKALHKGGSGENRNGFFANNAFFTPNKYTISFWTKKDDLINTNYSIARFVCTFGYGFAGDRVYYDNLTKQLYWGIYNADNQWLVITSDAITSEQTQWQFYTLTYDGTDVKLYRNGILCSTRSGYAMLSNYLSKYRIGIIYGSAFSDFRIYATALSAEDIKNLYNSPISVSKQHQTMAFEFVEGNDGFSANKNGIVQHNELRENDSDVNGCYNDKLITNELIEN